MPNNPLTSEALIKIGELKHRVEMLESVAFPKQEARAKKYTNQFQDDPNPELGEIYSDSLMINGKEFIHSMNDDDIKELERMYKKGQNWLQTFVDMGWNKSPYR